MDTRGSVRFLAAFLLVSTYTEPLLPQHLSTVEPVDPVQDALDYLASVQDAYHRDRFWVYEDLGSPGNHFHAWARFPSPETQAEMVGSHEGTVNSGATSIRCEFKYGSPFEFGGFNMLNGILPPGAVAPEANFGEIPGAGITELAGAVALVFHARGEKGGERVDFFTLGVGVQEEAPFPDSSEAVHLVPEGTVELSTQWTRYEIPLNGSDLSYVLGGFGWGVSGLSDADGDQSVVFFVDDIYFQLSPEAAQKRAGQPRFLGSFTTEPHQTQPAPLGDFDFVLRNTAFTYDNALALLAFLAAGGAENLHRARLIGDAFVYASENDRSYTDGRLRDAYSAGDIALPPGWLPNAKIATVPVSGFFDTDEGTFFEIFQDGISTGNNAWAMIALLGLHRRTGDGRYLAAAQRIGEFIQTFRNDLGVFQGFQGGLDTPETAPARRPWASTEHNLDIDAAFLAAHRLTGQRSWLEGTLHARKFVEAMRDEPSGCFLAGTTDPENRNTTPGQLPLDTQSWSILALSGALTAPQNTLACAETNHGLEHHGFLGFDFNEDRDGVWFEGTAQMAVAYAHLLDEQSAQLYRDELSRAQHTPPFGDGIGIAAACHNGVSTGFQDRPGEDFLLFRRLHVAATAWNVFAQLGFNPFHQTTIPSPPLTRIVFPQAVVGSLGDQAFEIDLSLVNSNPSAEWTGTVWLLRGSDLTGMQGIAFREFDSHEVPQAEAEHPVELPPGGTARYSITGQTLQVGVLVIESHEAPAGDLAVSFFYRLTDTGTQLDQDLIAVQPTLFPDARLRAAYTRSPTYTIGVACVAEKSLAASPIQPESLEETLVTVSVFLEDGSTFSGQVILGGDQDAHRAFFPHEFIPGLPTNVPVAALQVEAQDSLYCTLLAVGQPPEFANVQIAATPALSVP